MWDLIVSVPDHCLSFYFLIYFLFHSICSVKMWNADFFTPYFITLRVQFGKKNLTNKFN